MLLPVAVVVVMTACALIPESWTGPPPLPRAASAGGTTKAAVACSMPTDTSEWDVDDGLLRLATALAAMSSAGGAGCCGGDAVVVAGAVVSPLTRHAASCFFCSEDATDREPSMHMMINPNVPPTVLPIMMSSLCFALGDAVPSADAWPTVAGVDGAGGGWLDGEGEDGVGGCGEGGGER